VEKMVSS